MVATQSTMVALGTQAPTFVLPDTEGKIVRLSDFSDASALLVIFMCNHCPYVIHIREKLVELIREYQSQGVAVVGINSNDVANYPEDSPAKMKEYAEQYGYTFPYLYDATQEVARAYAAACTPDFFCSLGIKNWCTGARWTRAGRRAIRQLRERICGRRWMRSWPARTFRELRSRVWAAI